MILATLVKLVHLAVILFVIIIPFIDDFYLHILHFTFGVSLLVHWYCNNNICSLTLLEAKLRGIDINGGFLYQFIAPVYDFLHLPLISENQLSSLMYIVVISLMGISLYKILRKLR